MQRHVWAVSVILAAVPALGQAQDLAAEEITFEGERWQLEKIGAGESRPYLGRDSLFLERAQISLMDREFSQGVIEFELAADQPSGFVGVNFRADDTGNSEQFYVRFHQRVVRQLRSMVGFYALPIFFHHTTIRFHV